MKKLINIAMASVLGVSVVGIAQAAAPVDQGSGTVTFQGQVVAAPCGIDPQSVDQTVNFGVLSADALKGGGVSPTKNFEIKLVNCDITSFKAAPTSGKGTVAVAFTGGTVQGDSNMLATTGGTGVGITVTSQQDGAVVPMDGTPSSALLLKNGSNTFAFGAVAKAAKGTTATPGDFSAIANFSLSYE